MLAQALCWRHGTVGSVATQVLARPEHAKLLRGFGSRPGDLGVVAEGHAGQRLGAAWCRLWCAEDHSYGYLDSHTPELGIAVVEAARGRGIGERLLRALATRAAGTGAARLSLSVELENPARRLYERLGYREAVRDGRVATWVLDLRDPALWRGWPRHRPADIEPTGPGQQSVWSYPRPPRLEWVSQPVRVEHRGCRVALSRRALRVCETGSPPAYYLPPADVRTDLLAAESRETFCEWKGVARYWTLRVGGSVVPRAAWSYPRPEPRFAALRDHLAFFAGRVDGCFVGAGQVRPQPGGYYGGWITPELVGPFKGGPGSEDW